MFESLSLSSLLILGAVGTYVLGFLFRNPIYIRLLVVLGSVFYAWYYWVAGPEPLWDAIFGSALIAVASAQGVIQLAWSKSPSSVRKENRHIFQVMPGIEPGLFNRLMKFGEKLTVETPIVLTREETRPEALWFLVKGEVVLERNAQNPVSIGNAAFIGELAWMLNEAASATVVAQPGARLVRWNHDDLRKLVKRSQRLELALEAAIATDIARKLARSRPIDDPVAIASSVKIGA